MEFDRDIAKCLFKKCFVGAVFRRGRAIYFRQDRDTDVCAFCTRERPLPGDMEQCSATEARIITGDYAFSWYAMEQVLHETVGGLPYIAVLIQFQAALKAELLSDEFLHYTDTWFHKWRFQKFHKIMDVMRDGNII